MSDNEPQDITDRPDGFRPRRKRAKGWLKAAIKDGSVRDPALGENPPEEHSPKAYVVAPPGATITTSDQE